MRELAMPTAVAALTSSAVRFSASARPCNSSFVPHSSRSFHRLLLQGNGPNATLPNLFGLPTCSSYGSYDTSVFRTVTRPDAGIFKWGSADEDPYLFNLETSNYVEPIMMIALPGVFGWIVLKITLCCFCYRRYWLGLCGEPFPTVKGYTPRQVGTNMCVTAISCAVMIFMSYIITLITNASFDAALESFLSAGSRAEALFISAFATGRALLGSALIITAELNAWEALVEARVDTVQLNQSLGCAATVLGTLPNGTALADALGALGSATYLFPPLAMTDALFAELRRPHESYPALIPPVIAWLLMLRSRLAGLPSLPRLGGRLDALNASVLNMSGVPTSIAAQLVAVNESVRSMPNLTLLQHRLGHVHELQTEDNDGPWSGHHICSNIDAQYWGVACHPDGSCPSDRLFCDYSACDASGCGRCELTECELLEAQLQQLRAALLALEPARPLELLENLGAMLKAVPPLVQTATELQAIEIELHALPNLPARVAEYVALKEVLAQWNPRTIEVSILATQAAANSLLAANTIGILPELVRQQAAVEPLDCVGTLINTLLALNATLVRLEPAAVTLVRRLGSLSAALRALPDPVHLNQSIIGLDGAIGALPALATYTAGVYVINAAITAMPSAAALTTGLLALETTRTLSAVHVQMVNATRALSAALGSLPPTGPLKASLGLLVAHRSTLPARLTEGLTKINAYHRFGTGSGDPAVAAFFDSLQLDVLALIDTVDAKPDDTELRARLEVVDASLAEVPPTMPLVAQLEALYASIGQRNDFVAVAALDDDGNVVNSTGGGFVANSSVGLPNVTSYIEGLERTLEGLQVVPPVGALSSAWATLRARLGEMPAWGASRPLIVAYEAELDALPSPPASLLEGGTSLYQMLAAVPSLVAQATSAVLAEHTRTTAELDLLELALLGLEGDGYMDDFLDMSPNSWKSYVYSFYVPAALSGCAFLSCCARWGRPSLHAGQLLLVLLPWYILVGASIELPASIVLQDVCGHIPTLASRVLTNFARQEASPGFEYAAGIAAGTAAGAAATSGVPRTRWDVAQEHVIAWLTNCEAGDPFSSFFTPLDTTTSAAQADATAALAALELLPVARAQVDQLAQEAAAVSADAALVRQTVRCGTVHAIYQDARTAVCCDAAYAITAIFIGRFVCLIAMCTATVGAIMGYKRFRRQRDLWGPYASMEAREVGYYL